MKIRLGEGFVREGLLPLDELSDEELDARFSEALRKFLKADQRKKQSIVMEDLGFIHARQSSYQNVEKHQEQIGRMIIDPMGRVLENTLQSAAQTEFMTKALDQKQTAEMGEEVRLEGKVQCLQALAHFAANKKQVSLPAPQTVHFGRFLARDQNATICVANKRPGESLAVISAFLRLKRWAILARPLGTETLASTAGTLCKVRLVIAARSIGPANSFRATQAIEAAIDFQQVGQIFPARLAADYRCE